MDGSGLGKRTFLVTKQKAASLVPADLPLGILGSISRGWLFLKGQARLQRELPASVQSSPAPKDP
jgi:hypothetical protein